MTPGVGALVLYHDRSAAVESVNGDKFGIRIEGGDRKNVRPKDVEFLHPGPVSSLPPEDLPAPDWTELVELVGDEKFSFEEFVSLAYGSFTPASAYSCLRMLREGIYFCGTPADGVSARSADEIAAALELVRAREAEREKRAALLERILEALNG